MHTVFDNNDAMLQKCFQLADNTILNIPKDLYISS